MGWTTAASQPTYDALRRYSKFGWLLFPSVSHKQVTQCKQSFAAPPLFSTTFKQLCPAALNRQGLAPPPVFLEQQVLVVQSDVSQLPVCSLLSFPCAHQPSRYPDLQPDGADMLVGVSGDAQGLGRRAYKAVASAASITPPRLPRSGTLCCICQYVGRC